MHDHNENIIVIGASAGGISSVSRLISTFPSNLNASIFVVLHLSRESNAEILRDQFQRLTVLPCIVPEDKATIEKQTIYLAPADHHMMLVKGQILITHGPYENHWRPAVDVLFRSAAASYGGCVTGIILTGMMDDGTSGMEAIKKSHGITIVQDPQEAEFADMPLNVLRQISVDHILPIDKMANVIANHLATSRCVINQIPEDVKLEAEITIRMSSDVNNLEKLGNSTTLTCPDCGGSLMKINSESGNRYRCYTGHSFSELALDNAQQIELENSVWVAIRMMEERRILLNTMDNYAPIIKTERMEALKNHIDRLKEMLQKLAIKHSRSS